MWKKGWEGWESVCVRRVSGGVVFAQSTVQHSFSADLVSESSSAELALVAQQQRTCGAAAGVAAFAAGLQLQSQLIIISRVSWRRSEHNACARNSDLVPILFPWGLEHSERDAWRHCKEPAFGPMGAQNLQQSLNCTLHTPFGEIDVGVVW